jgi:hypothetical protein
VQRRRAASARRNLTHPIAIALPPWRYIGRSVHNLTMRKNGLGCTLGNHYEHGFYPMTLRVGDRIWISYGKMDKLARIDQLQVRVQHASTQRAIACHSGDVMVRYSFTNPCWPFRFREYESLRDFVYRMRVRIVSSVEINSND